MSVETQTLTMVDPRIHNMTTVIEFPNKTSYEYHLNEKFEIVGKFKCYLEEYLYLNGKLHGLYKSWFENSQLKKECNYVNGQKHGLYKEYYENGQLCIECNYVNGLRSGLTKKYYENGQLYIKCNYVNGKLHGLSQQWFENSHLREESNYVNGLRSGLTKKYYNNGRLKEESNYVEGILNGSSLMYGKLVKELYYYKGVEIKKHWFTNPESITTKEWLSINNAEHRRVLMDIFKEKNIKAPIELVKIDECDNCILYRSKEKDSLLRAYIRYAFVVCPSTKREYYIPVPPSVRKAKDAVTGYAPIIET